MTGPSGAYARFALVLTAVLLLFVAITAPAGQDWLPFQTASLLASRGLWTDIYPAPTATSLFDVSPRFLEAAASIARLAPGTLTAFVAPPPAAFLAWPFELLPGRLAVVAVRVAEALPIILALFVQASVVSGASRESGRRYATLVLLSLPLLLYTLLVGQPSAWLLPAVTATLHPGSRRVDVAGGVSLAMVGLCKATPLLLIPVAWLLGRTRLAGIAGAIVLGVTVATMPFTPISAWIDFLRAGSRLSSVVIADWNNLSPESLLTLVQRGVAKSLFLTNLGAAQMVGEIVRVVLVCGFLYVSLKSAADVSTRAAAFWLVWLSVSPLLWLHYLVVLLPVVAFQFLDTRRAMALVGLPSVLVIARAAGMPGLFVGLALGTTWLVATIWMLSRWLDFGRRSTGTRHEVRGRSKNA